MGDVQGDNDVKYVRFLERRRHLEQQRRQSLDEFDRQVLILAAGALALSITYLHNIAARPLAWTIVLLILAWAALLTAIVATVLSFRESAKAFLQQIKAEDENYRTGKPLVVDEAAALRTRWLTRIAALGFALGLSFLALFAVFNVRTRTGGTSNGDAATHDSANTTANAPTKSATERAEALRTSETHASTRARDTATVAAKRTGGASGEARH
jgi:hypothetical protein